MKTTKLISAWEAQKAMVLSTIESDQSSEVAASDKWKRIGSTLASDLNIAFLPGNGIDIAGVGKLVSSLISLLQEDSATINSFSSRVFSQDNNKASFNYGDEIFYRASVTSPVQKENIDLNLNLGIKRVSNKHVNLDLDLSSKMLSSGGSVSLPNFISKKIKQTISLPFNKVLVISGLKSSKVIKLNTKYLFFKNSNFRSNFFI